MWLKKRRRCNQEKDSNKFYKNTKSEDNLHWECKECIKELYPITEEISNKKKVSGYGKWKLASLKQSAKNRNLTFDLTGEILENWWLSTEDCCYYCKMDIDEFIYLRDFILQYEGENKEIHKFKRVFVNSAHTKISSMTIDRKNNDLGYQIDNIVKSCWFCNFIKRDFLTENEMLSIAKGIINRLWDAVEEER